MRKRYVSCSTLPSSVVSVQPSAVRVPRRRLELPVAVLLLRTSYDAVDALDFVPMNNFQISFWETRRSGQEAYGELVKPGRVTAGDLGDAFYFDYLCSAQSLALRNAMARPLNAFEERSGAEGESRVVRRDAQVSNAALPEAYAVMLGDELYRSLRDGFTINDGTSIALGGPAPCARGDARCLVDGVRRIANIFASSGFCINATVEADESAAPPLRIRVRLEGAATLFAAASVGKKMPAPAFVEYTLASFARASGYKPSWSWNVSSTSLTSDWTFA